MTPPQEQAAVLLEAVARYCENSLDPEIPTRCGHAADLLARSAAPIPTLADDRAELIAAMKSAVAHLTTVDVSALDDAEVDRITAAAAEVRAALAVAQR